MRARSGRTALAVYLAGAALASAVPVEVRAAEPSSPCAQGAVVHEDLYAPQSVPSGAPFDVTLVVSNCTDAPQSLSLEGKQRAPGACFAPAIDPIGVRLAPRQRFTMQQTVAAESCTGTYTVAWSVYQKNAEIAHRTRHTTIT
jgi:hypothetical protein